MKHEDVNKSLSEWMDEELSERSHDVLYKELVGNEDGRKSFESFHAIRAVLKNESSTFWQAGFSDRVSSAIAGEPTVLAPKRGKSDFRKLFTGWAVAASVALTVVIGAQWYPGSVNQVGTPLVAESSSSDASDTMLAEYHVTEEEKTQLERINTIFSKFSQSPQVGNNALPFVRLVSGEQVKTYRMTPRQFRQVMMELEKRNREAELKAKEELHQSGQ